MISRTEKTLSLLKTLEWSMDSHSKSRFVLRTLRKRAPPEWQANSGVIGELLCSHIGLFHVIGRMKLILLGIVGVILPKKHHPLVDYYGNGNQQLAS